ncbi:U-box domain-containing protein 5 [Canna indica]|uniref:RING-type E3 ubiquitin transferase n=1 Tax=Canna indica TaxID=4628 RepID=A0AAQ3Q903_9LILI|nr:U-box domain-containing protein 5 [Canna indica]
MGAEAANEVRTNTSSYCMGTGVPRVVKDSKKHIEFKVNSSICLELTKILDKIHSILPAIESVHPGFNSGIQELCCLNNSIDKAKLLLQHCTDSSKLYLAITREATLSRCERIKSSLINSLCQIQNMVPPPLESKVSEVLDYLRVAKFRLDSSEEEAGRALLGLLRQTDSTEALEFEAFQIAASRLKLTSPKAILLERRSLNKLLDKLNELDTKKEKIVNYFLYLLKKHGKNVSQDSHEHKENGDAGSKNFKAHMNSSRTSAAPIDVCQATVPPEEFCCPISSRLMYDPVVIASGQTYERVYIEKWFHDGHNTCPKTRGKLANLSIVPNACMKDLIVNWCKKHGVNVPEPCTGFSPAEYCHWEASHSYSISSLKNVSAALLDGSIGPYFLQNDSSNVSFISSDASYCSDSSHVNFTENSEINHNFLFSWCDDYQQCQSFSNFSHEMFLRFFHRLLELPSDVQGRAVEDVKVLLESDEEISYVMLTNGFAEALISVMKNALEISNIPAMKTGTKLFLALLSLNRIDISFLTEDAKQLFLSFLDSELTKDALVLLQKLVQHPSYGPKTAASDVVISIINILDSEDLESLELSLKILLDLSSDSIKSFVSSSGLITKLASFLLDGKLVDLCLKLIQNISDNEEGALLVAKSNACLASIVEVLETGSHEEQEHAVAIVHSICSGSYENCLLILDEGVIPPLVDISVNGNAKGKEISKKLLHLLRDVRSSDRFISYIKPESTAEPEVSAIAGHSTNKQPISKSTGFLKKLRFFSKPKSLTPC